MTAAAHGTCHAHVCHAAPPRPRNGLGVAGFIVSLCALVFSAGLLSPVGLVMSLLALRRRPRGMAFAGVLLGLAGSLWLLALLALVIGAIGVGAAVAVEESRQDAVETGLRDLRTWSQGIEARELEEGRLLAFSEIRAVLADRPDPWGNALRLELAEDGGRLLRSAGADGRFETKDDLKAVVAFPR